MARIVLGVTGGIAAYKAGDIIRGLKKKKTDVTCVMTRSAGKFITPLTLRKLSGNPVYCDMFAENKKSASKIRHIGLARECDAVLIAPATANIIGKIASGIADDLLTTVVMASEKPVLIAPAMNSSMWNNKIVRSNVIKLKKYGYIFIGPAKGALACGEEGAGHIEPPENIVEAVTRAVKKKTLKGKKVLITSGPTREYIDKIRFISNPSSGKTGYYLAEDASSRGADVVFITGETEFVPENARVVRVTSAADMFSAVKRHLATVDIFIGAAAVGDFRVKTQNSGKKTKIQRQDKLKLELTPTEDILASAGRRKGKKVFVGFAAEAGGGIKRAKEKLRKKNLDIIVYNNVSGKNTGFGSDSNRITILGPGGKRLFAGSGAKSYLASVIMDKTEEVV